MPTIPCKDAWARARDRYVEDLSEEEKALFENASPESLFYDASAAQKLHASNSTTQGVMDKIQPLVAAIDQYGKALDVYANAYPLVMSPLWGSLRVLLHLAREYGKYFEKIIDMLARIGDVLPRFRVYENLFPSHERLVQVLSVAYIDIVNFCTKSKAVFRHGRRASLTNFKIAFKITWKPFERQFEQQIADFRVHLKNVEKEVDICHMVEAADSRAVVLANKKQLAKAEKESKYRRMIAAIPAVDVEAKHRNLQTLRHPGTGAWIFEDRSFKNWKASIQTSTLCCRGIPGCGKTVLASTIIDELRLSEAGTDRRVIYYYCDYANQLTLQPTRIFGTLLRQSFVNVEIPEAIEKRMPLGFIESGQSLELQDLVDLLCLAFQHGRPHYIILDGLDECGKEARAQVMSVLDRLSGLGSALLKTLILCREEDQLLRTLSQVPQIKITPETSKGDIESFVVESVKTRIQSEQLRIRNPRLENEIVSELTSKAHGMFLWVFFQLDDLCEAPSDAIIRETLKNLPDGLIETYQRIMTKIAQNDLTIDIARKMFLWIACAKRPMRIEEVKEAAAFDLSDKVWDSAKMPDEDLMIELCRGLVIRDHGIVRFAHHTVQQYLLSEDTRSPEFTRSIKEAELFVGTMCLTYLSFSDFETQIEIRRPEVKAGPPLDLFQKGTVSWIPSIIGIQNSLFELPYRLFRSHASTPAPIIDFAKYLTPAAGTEDAVPTQALREKYQLLDYIIEYWTYHTREIEGSSHFRSEYNQLQDIAKYKNLSFEFRPWGPNRHFGKFGCISCTPGHAASQTAATELPFMTLLHYAAEIGHWPLMEPLVQHYCHHERSEDTTLVIACRNNHLGIVKKLMKLSDFDLSNGKAVNAAAAAGHEDVLFHLLDGAARRYPRTIPFSTPKNGYQPLVKAAANGHEAVVDLLHDWGAEIDATGKKELEVSPLFAAARNGHDHVVRYLLSREARVVRSGTTALHCAAENGHEVVVRTLLSYKDGFIYSLLNVKDQDDETPLHKAARNGHNAVVKELLRPECMDHIRFQQNYVQWDRARNNGEYEAIKLAAMNGHVGVLELFSDYGLIDVGTLDVLSPVMLAAEGGHVSAIEWLVTNGANDTRQSSNSESGTLMEALETAAFCGHEEAIRTLLDCTPEANAPRLFPNIYLGKLLVLAATEKHMKVLATLIERIRSVSHANERHDPEYLPRQLEEAGRLALRKQRKDAAQLLQNLSASARKQQKHDAVTSSG